MRDNSNNILVLLIVLAIALLPIRFGHTVGVDDHAAAGEAISSHLDMHNCDLDENVHTTSGCDDHSSDGSLVDDCCGDQCSSAQTLLSGAFNLHFAPSNSYDLVWSQWLPETIVAIDYRPPIKLS